MLPGEERKQRSSHREPRRLHATSTDLVPSSIPSAGSPSPAAAGAVLTIVWGLLGLLAPAGGGGYGAVRSHPPAPRSGLDAEPHGYGIATRTRRGQLHPYPRRYRGNATVTLCCFRSSFAADWTASRNSSYR